MAGNSDRDLSALDETPSRRVQAAPPRRRSRTDTDPAQSQSSAEPASPTPGESAASTEPPTATTSDHKTRSHRRPRKSTKKPARRRNTVVLTASLYQQMYERCYRENVAPRQILLEAVDAHPRPSPEPDEGVSEPAAGRLAPPRSGPPRPNTQVTVDLPPQTVEVLDQLVDEAGMRSRSELFRQALRAYLDV